MPTDRSDIFYSRRRMSLSGGVLASSRNLPFCSSLALLFFDIFGQSRQIGKV